ncbi:uncharacterized protein LOC135494985 [Lineus longissimus]|uniref:uncharacterized protein LOC135494985 n=1 Tax=Lineus longissimus TaxID=88925 RepID=UPI002B4F2EED
MARKMFCLGITILVLCLVVDRIKGEQWTVILTFYAAPNTGTTNQVYGLMKGSRADCGWGLLNNRPIPSGGFVLTTLLTCASAIGRVKSFTIRTDGTDGADLIKLEVKTATVDYILLDMKTSSTSLRMDRGVKSFTAETNDSARTFEQLTDSKLGGLVEGPGATYSLLDCTRRCAANDACEAYRVVSSNCELRRHNDGSSLGTKTYYRLKYTNVL